jgi:hypothetical protein
MDKAKFLSVAVPMLKIDEGVVLTPARKLERRVVAALLSFLAERGFVLKCLDDGEEIEKVATPADAMELIFNLDESVLYVRYATEKRGYGITLIPGNSWWEIVSDNACPIEDPRGFAAAMDEFTDLMIELSDDTNIVKEVA